MSPLPRTSPVLNSDASPHANRLARPPRFEIFEDDEVRSDSFENIRCQSPTPVTHTPQEVALYIVCLATPRAATPLVSPPPVLQALTLSTISVNIDEEIDESLLSRIRNGYSGNPSVGSSSSTELRATPSAST
jgi:hypothetical protein